jgi:hypothetical protein
MIRHLFDGDLVHWNDDNTSFRYARCHVGTEISEEGYAFNEGFAQYWQQARWGGRVRLPGVGATTDYCDGLAGPRGILLTAEHMDWVEMMVGNQLLDLAECVGGGTSPAQLDAGDNLILQTLRDNPGTIHSLIEFENELCNSVEGGCCGLDRGTIASCPPGYDNHGLTCAREGHIITHRRF